MKRTNGKIIGGDSPSLQTMFGIALLLAGGSLYAADADGFTVPDVMTQEDYARMMSEEVTPDYLLEKAVFTLNAKDVTGALEQGANPNFRVKSLNPGRGSAYNIGVTLLMRLFALRDLEKNFEREEDSRREDFIAVVKALRDGGARFDLKDLDTPQQHTARFYAERYGNKDLYIDILENFANK